MEKLDKIRFEFFSKKSLVRNIFDTFLASCESEAVPEAAAEQERKILLHNFWISYYSYDHGKGDMAFKIYLLEMHCMATVCASLSYQGSIFNFWKMLKGSI